MKKPASEPASAMLLSFFVVASYILLDPTFEADPIGRRLEYRPKKGIFID